MRRKTNDKDSSPSLSHHQRRAIVSFADLRGFDAWTHSPLFSHTDFHEKIISLYYKFVTFTCQYEKRFFSKRIGDGLMFVMELPNNKKTASMLGRFFVEKTEEFIADIEETLKEMDSPKPKGIRIRRVAGDVLKLIVVWNGKTEIDYIGAPVNLAFNLQAVQPEITSMTHESVIHILDLKSGAVKATKLAVPEGDYKGVDNEILKELYDLKFT